MIDRIRTILTRLRWAFAPPPNKLMLEFNATDAPMLVHAFRIAGCTARMCQHPGAEKKFDEYRKACEAHVPAAARHFEEETWGEMGAVLVGAKIVSVTLEPPPWRNNLYYGGCIAVRIDDHKFRTRGTEFQRGDPAVEEIFQALSKLKSMECAVSFDAKTPERNAWAA